MTLTGHVAFDLGAESGRAMLATFDGTRITLDEIHRFANQPQQLPDGYHWNLLDLWANIVKGLGLCCDAAKDRNIELAGVGIDTWGVDFGLVGKSGQLLGLPYCYRDDSHAPAMQHAIDSVGRDFIYNATGIQLMAPNSLYQLIARYQQEPGLIDQADRLLMIPDILHWFLSGEMVNEATNASTTQMLNMNTGRWATGLLEKLNLPTHMLGNTIAPGTTIGSLRSNLGMGKLPVIVPATHDTASAIAAAPGSPGSNNWAYLSSGTWSLMGVEIERPIINEQSRAMNITNEGGVNHTIRLLKNIAGLWLVQQCRIDMEMAGETYDYPTLTDMASQSKPFRTLIDTNHPPFALPGNMRENIATFARDTQQPIPQTPGQFVRCCLESLAMTYRQTLEQIQTLTGSTIDVLHIVGGGGRNELLNQLTADAIGRPVIVGPYEATAVGNALVQALGCDLAAIRQVVRDSFDLITIKPQNASAFNDQMQRFDRITSSAS